MPMELEDRRLLAPFTVTSAADDGSTGTLRWAITQANGSPGVNTISFDPTVFATPQTITLTRGVLDPAQHDRDADDHRPGSGRTPTGGGRQKTGFLDVHSRVTASISGLTVTGGKAAADGGFGGGGLLNLGTVTLTNCTVSGNSADGGGGLYNSRYAGHDRLHRYGQRLSTPRGTLLFGGGGGGGGVFFFFSVTAFTKWGGLSNESGSTAVLDDCTVTGNTGANGGGVYNSGGTVDLTDCTLGNNSGSNGAGLLTFAGKVTLDHCTVVVNSAYATGGGDFGGGLANVAVGTTGGTMDLDQCTVSSNFTNVGGGGGIYNSQYSDLSVLNCTVYANSAPDLATGQGGGFFNDGTMAVIACTIADNQAGEAGGGVYNGNSAGIPDNGSLSDTIVANNFISVSGSINTGEIAGTLCAVPVTT